MTSIETFTKRLNGILDSIGNWFDTALLKEDDCDYREDYDSYPPDDSCYLYDPDESWVMERAEKKVYDDTLVAKAAEEYPSEWIEETEGGRHGGFSIKYAIKRDSNDDLFFKVIDVNDKYLMRYVDAGKTYLAPKISTIGAMVIWEIPSEIMKRDVSQFLIYYEGRDEYNTKPYWSVELDF
jgi:hypothetical protein